MHSPREAVSHILLCAALVGGGTANAATLPEHAPLRVLVVSDEVNPNGLSDADLTQPGDISSALNADDSGLNLAADAAEVSSQCVDDALTALESDTPPDVVVYFAHRGALGCDGQDRQAQFTADIEQLLIAGGGLVVFHHGIYAWSGKDEILDLIGGESNSIAWDTQTGQRIFNVAPDHFVTSNGLQYDQSGQFEGTDGVAAGDYAYFDNVPDERYPNTTLVESTDATREILFASNSGGARVVGYTLTRPGWTGRVVTYQSGEYQPNALDDRDGRNFQILANAILYSTGAEGDTEPPSDDPPAQDVDAGAPSANPEPSTEDTSTSEPSADDGTTDDDGMTGDGTDDPSTAPDSTDDSTPDDATSDDGKVPPNTEPGEASAPTPTQEPPGTGPIDPPSNEPSPPSGDPAPTATTAGTATSTTALPASSNAGGEATDTDDPGSCGLTAPKSNSMWVWCALGALALVSYRARSRVQHHLRR